MKAELVPENGDPPIPIVKDLTVVGRRPYCDVIIDHDSLSKRHCVLVKTDGLLVIRDLITTNGTKVKGQRIRWAALLPDDRITLGACKFRLYLGPDDSPAPSELYATRGRSKTKPGASTSLAEDGFPSPSPLEVPIPGDLDLIEDDLDIIDDDDEVNGTDESLDSGWRKMFQNSSPHKLDEDDLIELE